MPPWHLTLFNEIKIELIHVSTHFFFLLEFFLQVEKYPLISLVAHSLEYFF